MRIFYKVLIRLVRLFRLIFGDCSYEAHLLQIILFGFVSWSALLSVDSRRRSLVDRVGIGRANLSHKTRRVFLQSGGSYGSPRLLLASIISDRHIEQWDLSDTRPQHQPFIKPLFKEISQTSGQQQHRKRRYLASQHYRTKKTTGRRELFSKVASLPPPKALSLAAVIPHPINLSNSPLTAPVNFYEPSPTNSIDPLPTFTDSMSTLLTPFPFQ
ncbi:hypothetical protein RRG08_064333 [Elysia crispata]|uniref:Uncharacterized protein n=1 Tax=Elysia crispata TaxID=231223 RepID=A0AAE1B6C0_9GAST|nr:hypothetical protein RRG08_064333 [Elysia crispata]